MVLGYGAGDGGVVWGVYDVHAGMVVRESESGYGELDVFVSEYSEAGGPSFGLYGVGADGL